MSTATTLTAAAAIAALAALGSCTAKATPSTEPVQADVPSSFTPGYGDIGRFAIYGGLQEWCEQFVILDTSSGKTYHIYPGRCREFRP
jgi:hypothetical protein